MHTVVGRDTLWSIAEEQLGSAQRWKEIAALNYQRVQSDGGQLTADHWVRPGWELLLPGNGETAHGGSRADTDPRSPIDRTEITTTDPMATAVPAGPLAAPVATVAPSEQQPKAANTASAPKPSMVPIAPIAPIAPVGAGIVGVGVVDLVDRLRRVQQRHRTRGTRIRLPDPDLRHFEQRLRVGDGPEVLQSVDDALELFRRRTGEATCRVRVLGVRVSDDTLELVVDALEAADSVPAPFARVPDAPIVTVPRADLASWARKHGADSRQASSEPTLVTVGRSERSLVMVNLEGLGSLVVDGDRHQRDGVVRALALELATAHRAPRFDLVLVGFGAEMERFERVTATSDATPLIDDLSWGRIRDSILAGDAAGDSAGDAGGDASHMSMQRTTRDVATRSRDPLVVICGPDVPEADVSALLELAQGGGRGIAVVATVASDEVSTLPSGAHRLHAGADAQAGWLALVGDLVRPQVLATEEVAAVGALLDSASDNATLLDVEFDDDGPVGAPPTSTSVVRAYAHHTPTTSSAVVILPSGASAPTAPSGTAGGEQHPPQGQNTSSRGGARCVPAGPEVEVSVLGPVEIRGASRQFTRAWALELVVYLAMRPNGASNELWATALWPERLMAPSSLHSTVSVARRSLGKATDGSDHLPKSHGRLALASTVGTDWERFQRLADSDEIEQWRAALELVRGRPFDGLRSADWAILDGTSPAIESAVVDLSGRLSGAYLRAGDPRGAEWAARRGLMVSPYDERLYRMLLRSADAAGNPSGVESVMAELVRVVADEIEPIESVHPSTLALYRSLSRRQVAVL